MAHSAPLSCQKLPNGRGENHCLLRVRARGRSVGGLLQGPTVLAVALKPSQATRDPCARVCWRPPPGASPPDGEPRLARRFAFGSPSAAIRGDPAEGGPALAGGMPSEWLGWMGSGDGSRRCRPPSSEGVESEAGESAGPCHGDEAADRPGGQECSLVRGETSQISQRGSRVAPLGRSGRRRDGMMSQLARIALFVVLMLGGSPARAGQSRHQPSRPSTKQHTF